MNDRRCTSEVCMATATGRSASLDLSMSQVLTDPAKDWRRLTAGRTRVAREIEVDWGNFCQDRFIFSHCFVPETAVLMADGTEKPIEDVVVGDEVVSHTGNVRRVIKVMVREVDEDLVSVKAASLSETLSTGEHPYYVLRKERSKCKHNNNLKCVYGHTGRCSKRGCSSNDGQLGFAQASELHCGDRVFTPTMGEVRGGQFSFEQMRLLGYYASEGGVAVDERPTESNSVRFHISKDEMGTLGEEICQLMSQCFGVDSHGTIETEEQGGTTLSFASDEAYEWCLKHAGHIAKNKRLSKEVMFAEPMLQAEMLDTWVAGDGCVDSGQRRVRISTVSPFLASQAEVLFSRIGGLAHIYEGENPGGPTGRDKKFRIFQVAAKSDCLGVLDGRYDFPSYSRWPRTGRRYRHAACSVAEITTIENKRYKGPVYNLSVEEDESYVANRMAVHNCTIVASVSNEDNGYYIDPVCSPLVNNNGNAWTNPVLLATFRSFVGGENYLEHVQIPELSKGKILDAVIRPIRYKNSKLAKDAPVYYTDILVATERKHDKLCKRIAAGELGTMSMGCHIAGTSVLMANGVTKSIEDVTIGEKVKTHTGDISTVESTRTRETNDGEVHRLSISGIPDTYVTKEHPYWTLTGYDKCPGCGGHLGKKRAISSNGLSALEKGQWCSMSCYQKHFNSNCPEMKKAAVLFKQEVKFNWVPVEDILVGDYVSVPLGRKEKKRSCLERARCRLLGFYAAEGNLQRDAHGNIRSAEFTFGLDEIIASETVSLLKECGITDDKIWTQDRNRNGDESSRVVVHDKELAQWLYDCCGEHCDSKKLASWIIELDDESLLNIVGAYIDGDGHCRKDDSRFSTASCSKKLTEQIWTICMSLEMPCSFGGAYSNEGKKDYWTVTIRKGHGIKLNGYSVKYIDQPTNKKDGPNNFHGYMLRRVTGNESVDGSYLVYNLHVDSEDHSFIANGVAVHNCLANWVQCSRCGVVLGDNDPNCHHIDHQLLQEFTDESGIKRVVAELCGRSFRDENGIWVGDPESLRFIEASWVERPAFEGAVLNHFLSEIPKAAAKILELSTDKLEQTMEELFRTRVADSRGMMVLRVAIEEMNRRRRQDMSGRVAKTFWS